MNDMDRKVGVDSAVYRTLLESTRAIPWKIDWATKTFAYIGPQIESLLGWMPSSWIGVQDWVDRMHEDDRQRVFDFCVAQSMAGIDHEADYRALRKDGEFVWIRDVVHVVRKPDGEVDSLIGFMFDISDRKKTEQELARLHKELEELSFKDGLTGISNRRMFDSILELEWTSARRANQPLSILILDVDHFKQYNDHYGHLAGDDCLRRVAQRLSHAATRPRDFFARFGGEEFVLVLPESDEAAAMLVAERCRDLIFKEQIMHAASPTGQLLSVSIGVGTITPTRDDASDEFLETIDQRLYRAKNDGRNRIVANTR
jgi:diguanylate cyclase (GGDEF)-like protein/PAS domain S-box-containing protein